jgi:DNA-binding MarR family transcriptional regulator
MLSLEDHILTALRRISQAIDVWSRLLWRDFGLTAPQLAVLREILNGKNATPMSLAAALHLSQPTVTGILSRLEQQGLVRRERSESDRRSIAAVVTARGRALANKAPPLLRDRFREELAKISELGRKEILATLEQVATMMNAPETTDEPFLSIDKDEPQTKKSSARKRQPKRKAGRKSASGK